MAAMVAKREAMSRQFEVKLRKDDSKFSNVIKTLQEEKKKGPDAPTEIVLNQCEGGVEWHMSSEGVIELFDAIASIDTVNSLRFVNCGDRDGRRYLELEHVTYLLEKIGPCLEHVALDGGEFSVEEGFPVCEGPMGMVEFEMAIEGMVKCRTFDIGNGFKIQYLGNPAMGYFPTPVEMNLDSILYTISKLPMLTKEAAATINVTLQAAEVADKFNRDRSFEDFQVDGFVRLDYYEPRLRANIKKQKI
jgi:hypothetical protein